MYGLYEFLMMPFKLCNASLTFTTLMNFIFHEKLDVFVIIYIDDILMYIHDLNELYFPCKATCGTFRI
jgi:hypothetical protein